MKPSWIRRWFMKQDDLFLWICGFILLVTFISAAVWLVGMFIKLMFGVPA